MKGQHAKQASSLESEPFGQSFSIRQQTCLDDRDDGKDKGTMRTNWMFFIKDDAGGGKAYVPPFQKSTCSESGDRRSEGSP